MQLLHTEGVFHGLLCSNDFQHCSASFSELLFHNPLESKSLLYVSASQTLSLIIPNSLSENPFYCLAESTELNVPVVIG